MVQKGSPMQSYCGYALCMEKGLVVCTMGQVTPGGGASAECGGTIALGSFLGVVRRSG